MVMCFLYLIKAGFEMLSLGGNLSYRTFLFRSCLSLLQLLIKQGGRLAEKQLYEFDVPLL